MPRPLALALPLSFALWACAPLDGDGGPPEGPGEVTADEARPDEPTATPRCDGPRPTALLPLDPAAEPKQGQMAIQHQGAWLSLPLQEIRYDTVVVGTLAETTVTQVFANPLPDRLEAVYSFPLPDDAAVDDYAIRVGPRLIRGVMKKRADAEQTYDEARRAGQTAGLLTQERPNVFTQSVANIAAGETVEVEMHLVQPLRQRAGRYTLALPTVVGPRYVPGTPQPAAGAGLAPDTDRVPDASRISPPVLPAGVPTCVPLDIAVAIETSLPVVDLASRTHAVTTRTRGRGVAVGLRGAAQPDRDFELSWRLSGPQPRAELLAQAHGDGGYFALTIQPPQAFDRSAARPRELIFVVDVSGSMGGVPLDTATAAVTRALAGLRPDDTFNVITFSGSATSLAPSALRNTAEARELAAGFLAEKRLHGGGGTEMLTGVKAALDAPVDRERMRMVLFLTDGYIGNETEIFEALASRRGDARVFALGVGGSVNRFLIDGLARVGRGGATIMGPGEDPKAVVDEFHERIDRPVLTDISLDWGALAVADVTPAAIPDLFAGQPVVVYGRYTGALPAQVRLRGRLGGVEVDLPVDLARARQGAHDGIASMWARRRIDDLSSYPLHQSPHELADGPHKRAIVDLALAHRVMTPHTAFVAVEERRESMPDGTLRTVHVPVDMPHGVTMSAGAEVGESVALGDIGVIGRGGGGGTGRGAGAGFGGRATRVPSVRQARAIVSGSLDRDLIRRVVRAHLQEVRACYDQGLARDPGLRGRVSVRFTIGPDGAVTAADVTESTVSDAAVPPCIAAAMRRWTFPKPAGGAVVVTYPFVLEPG